ncbi:MAG: cell division protein FtsA [Tannerellaceae bacterium]|jgi:cell division protein FtsA|nr:cell division protein FtsA [Tannerellaceae bacterium]
MASNFIAAIHMGTSRIIGLLGHNDAGTLTVIAYEAENSTGCIRRGCVYNVKETAAKVKRIIQKMESRIPGNRIGKVYVSAGGQSVRSMEHTVSRSMDTESMFTDEMAKGLLREAQDFRPEGLDVLSILPSAYYLDGHPESDPVGVSCSSVEARYQLIVARPLVRKRIVECITELVKIDIAEVIVYPVALAEAVLNESERKRGCALVDFGGSVTSVTVYKNGYLAGLCVIPLGGNLITKDLADYLGVNPAEAEDLKRRYGNALSDEGDESTFQVDIENSERLTVKLSVFNSVVEARMQEILENVYDRLEATGLKELHAGVIITGNASLLENLAAPIYERLKTDVRYAAVRKDITIKTDLDIPEGDGACIAGLLLRGGGVSCLVNTVTRPVAAPERETVAKPKPSPDPAPEADKDETTTSGAGHRGRKPALEKIKKASARWTGRLFDDV